MSKEPPKEKYCSGCKTIKPIEEFSPFKKSEPNGRRQGKCKNCASLYRRQYPYNPAVQEAFYERHGGRNAYQKKQREKRLGRVI